MRVGFLMQEGAPDVRARPLTGPANHVVKVYEGLGALGCSLRAVVRYEGRIYRSRDLQTFDPVTVPRLDAGPARLVERGFRGVQSRLRLPYLNWFDSRRFAQACVQEFAECDVLYERFGWMSYGGGLTARQLNIPLVLEINNGDYLNELQSLGQAPRGLQLELCKRLMRRAAHRASQIVASGAAHRERFIELSGVPGERVTVVENGSDLVEQLSRDALRSFQDPLASAATVEVVFVGAFEPWHGLLNLLPAFSRALKRNTRLRLTLIGTGTQADQVTATIRHLELQPYVNLTGPLPLRDVALHLAGADIGVAPYCGWREFSGLKIFDYKAAGLAVICSGEGGQPATLAHNTTGWIVPPCDIDQLSEALVQLGGDQSLRRRLGRAARMDAEQTHSWRHTAAAVRVILQRAHAAGVCVGHPVSVRPAQGPALK